jgi:hypothetical protein
MIKTPPIYNLPSSSSPWNQKIKSV